MHELIPTDLSSYTTEHEVNSPDYNGFRPSTLPEHDINPLEQFKLFGSAHIKANENPISSKLTEIRSISKKCGYQLAEVYKDYNDLNKESGNKLNIDKYKFHSGVLVSNAMPIKAKSSLELGIRLIKLLETSEVNNYLKKFFEAKYNCSLLKDTQFKIFSAQFNKMGDLYSVGDSAKYNYIGLHEHKKMFDPKKIFCPLTTVIVIEQMIDWGDQDHFHVVRTTLDNQTFEFSLPTKKGDLIINDWETLHRVPKLKSPETVRVTLACQWQLFI